MRRVTRVLAASLPPLVGFAILAACGARTGLPIPVLEDARARDVESEPFQDVTIIHEAHFLDVHPDCDTPTYCVPGDPNYVYKCGVRIEQCSSLEQCEEPCGDAQPGDACAARCVNPCLNSLGQNTSNGCEFYAVEMDETPMSVGVCYAVFVVNQWQTGQPAKLQIDNGGAPYPDKEVAQFARIPSGTGTDITYAAFDPTVGLAQNQIAILFLSRDQLYADQDPNPTDPTVLANCPPGVTPAVQGDGAIHGTGIGTAFHIKANVPIVAYQMLPYGGGHARVTGATLLLPINVWGNNYLAANAYSFPPMVPICDEPDGGPLGCSARSGPTMDIIAQENNTHITINPVTAIVAGTGVAGAPAGTPITYTVDKGQYLQFTQLTELTGSAIQSDQPVAVLGGSTLIDLPTTSLRADHAEQMLPPVSALGSEYAAVRYRSRSAPAEESVPWRVVGAVNGTVLSYDPAPPPGAPAMINQGQVIEIDDPGPWVISSQDLNHPFYFAQYMTGGENFMSFGFPGEGDPEFVNVVSPAQFLPSYTFFTDPTYPETNLVIVAAFDFATSQFPTVTLDCAGVLGGWQALGMSGKYQFTRIDLSSGNYQGQNGCNNGVHTIKATLSGDGAPMGDVARIGVTIWGWGSGATYAPDNGVSDEENPAFTRWVSYAYPAGANFSKLNSVILPAN
jgi:IgGFc binding protein